MSKVVILIGVIVIVLVVGTGIIAVVWNWVVPDIFAGAVKQGLLPATLTLWQAFKLSCLVGAVIGSRSKD